jgi:hypothetical protein
MMRIQGAGCSIRHISYIEKLPCNSDMVFANVLGIVCINKALMSVNGILKTTVDCTR